MILRRVFAGMVCAGLLSLAAVAQTAAAPAPAAPAAAAPTPAPTFDVADVHVSPHRNSPNTQMGMVHGDRYIVRQATMVRLIATAYGVDNNSVLSGPSWLEIDRFDIVAKAPHATDPAAVKLMLRGLLTDRFHLVMHTDIKPLPAYVLSVGKGSKLKEADGTGEPGCRYQQPSPNTPPTPAMAITFSCHNESMDDFAEFLYGTANPYLRRPVVNSTGLKGKWDFDLQWTYNPPRAGADGITIFDAVDKQLGLKLEAKTAPLPVVIVDSVEEKPTPNAPGIDKALPPPPPSAFDVSVINPTAPGKNGMQIMINGNQLTANGATLRWLIEFAWDIDDRMLVGAPKWLDDNHFDILAKSTQDASLGPQVNQQVDIDELRQMVRTLLADRFKLAAHMEDQPGDAFVLLADKPHLKKADPLNRTGCKTGPGPDGKDPRIANPVLGRLVTCSNMSMAQFAVELQTLATGYIRTPVFNDTGIDGAYDFTLSFSTSAQLRGTPQGSTDDAPSATSASAAAAPSGGISLFDAVDKTLGVKLEQQKRPIPVLVLDHVEPKPTDN